MEKYEKIFNKYQQKMNEVTAEMDRLAEEIKADKERYEVLKSDYRFTPYANEARRHELKYQIAELREVIQEKEEDYQIYSSRIEEQVQEIANEYAHEYAKEYEKQYELAQKKKVELEKAKTAYIATVAKAGVELGEFSKFRNRAMFLLRKANPEVLSELLLTSEARERQPSFLNVRALDVSQSELSREFFSRGGFMNDGPF